MSISKSTILCCATTTVNIVLMVVIILFFQFKVNINDTRVKQLQSKVAVLQEDQLRLHLQLMKHIKSQQEVNIVYGGTLEQLLFYVKEGD